ncbi:MAG: hypothetical protein LBT78_06690 [Tannerella sp.]|nr:hypothetical protein [Tannerella sp.]
MKGWLAEADSASGLIPRNLSVDRDFWNARDAAADNYPFMVLTSSILHTDLFEGTMLDMLHSERKLTSRIAHLPASYSFSKQGYLDIRADTNEIIFGSGEYMKDGLLPLTEWLGKSPWSERMVEILDDLDQELHVRPETIYERFDHIIALEVSGDLLQVLSRVYWMTGNKKYLEWAIEFGDFYLNDRNLPTRSSKGLRLRDHGCEIVGGLSELYATVHYVDKDKKNQWSPYIHEMLDCILSKGRNEDGMFYNSINPVSGEIIDSEPADTWGYIYDAFYTVYLIDHIESYKDAVLKALHSIFEYQQYNWEHLSADGYADAIESALNLYFFQPLPETEAWLDSEINVLWSFQQPSGIIEGWHGDGNFARTTLMYCLWKTNGVTLTNWNEEVIYGSVVSNGRLYLSLTSPTDWSGTLRFRQPMHRENLHLPINYPRINQFQEWFPIEKEKQYRITNTKTNKTVVVTGQELINGYTVSVSGDELLSLSVSVSQ